MTAFIKTIRVIGSTTGTLAGMLFDQEPAYQYESYYVSEKAGGFQLPLKTWVKIAAGLAIVSCIGLSIYFVNAIVAQEYAISQASRNIIAEQEAQSELLANYSKIQSTHTVEAVTEQSSKGQFVSIDSVRYINQTAILQANASIR